MSLLQPTLTDRLTRSVLERTGRRILGLHIKLEADRVTLTGRTDSFHVKQLALSGIRELLPDASLKNDIAVVQ
ncbi:MAG: hypothetical protein U0798_11330 [Gemmataceae bacterium]